MTEKPRFDAMKAVHLVHGLAADQGRKRAPALLEDWKGYLLENFALEDEQLAWMDSLDEEQSALLTQELREILDSEGTKRLVVTMIADHARPGGMYHELRSESLETKDKRIQQNVGIVIAHCDAHCKNWGWGPA